VELVQDAKRTIWKYGSGDCDCKVVCLATLLGCLGHRSRFKVLGPSRSNYTHVYLEVYTRNCNCGRCGKRGGWMPLDPTPEHAPPGWEARGMPTDTYDIWPESIDSIGPAALFVGGLLLWWWLR
jgi:transglutaminase-like putative cysteine protease